MNFGTPINGLKRKTQNTLWLQCAASYVPQQAWLRQSTVRDNILALDHPFNPTRYDATLSACALTSDLAALPAGDLTEIGEKARNVLTSGCMKYQSRFTFATSNTACVVGYRRHTGKFHTEMCSVRPLCLSER